MLQDNEVVIKSNLFANLKAETSVNSGNWIVKNASAEFKLNLAPFPFNLERALNIPTFLRFALPT